jgi:hypothetical protein
VLIAAVIGLCVLLAVLGFLLPRLSENQPPRSDTAADRGADFDSERKANRGERA